MQVTPSPKAPVKILLCAPRGFCAGVDRAIQIVDLALEKYGAPVYVRHEIVHNKYVVEGLRNKGAVFVEELDEIPVDDRPVIFSAHGVPKSVPEAARLRNLFFLDATCPLVSKVHKEAILHDRREREILLIGHKGHPEVVGTMGQLPRGRVSLIETAEDARTFEPKQIVSWPGFHRPHFLLMTRKRSSKSLKSVSRLLQSRTRMTFVMRPPIASMR